MPKVILGMSGGVDSSVTAYLLKEQGYEVEGISLLLWEARDRPEPGGCCSLRSTESAARTAARLGLRHESVDVRLAFMEKVIEPFAEAYSKGLTPNPCILCNRHIKFPVLLEEARKRGAQYIATGHYARTERVSSGVVLKKAVDERKDQSYVLYVLAAEALDCLLLPLGDLRKTEVRQLARSLGLEAADRPESQEICFISDNDYCGFLEKLIPGLESSGPIIDSFGREVGRHMGVHRYTVGQRKGLGIASPEPHFVTRVDAASNRVFVGSREDAMSGEISVAELNWLLRPAQGSFRADIRIRSMMKPVPASVEVQGDEARVIFDEPQWAPAPGQSAVFYDQELMLGGGIIIGKKSISTGA